MNFREVWMNSDHNTLAQAYDTNFHQNQLNFHQQEFETCQKFNVILILLSIFLVSLNLLTILFFNRKSIARNFRRRFQQLQRDESINEALNTTELKG